MNGVESAAGARVGAGWFSPQTLKYAYICDCCFWAPTEFVWGKYHSILQLLLGFSKTEGGSCYLHCPMKQG